MWTLQIKQMRKSVDGSYEVPEKVTYKSEKIGKLLYIVKELAEVNCDNAEYTLTKEEEVNDGK